MANTRTVPRKDGGVEIIRILDESLLGRWTPDNPIAFEKSIVWLEPLDGLDFVRVALVRNAKSRRGPLLIRGASMILGYSKLTEDAPLDPATRHYTRRVFYLQEEDSRLNMNQFPESSVDPHTIVPGVYGEPPRIEQVERGYPWFACRAAFGSAPPSLPAS